MSRRQLIVWSSEQLFGPPSRQYLLRYQNRFYLRTSHWKCRRYCLRLSDPSFQLRNVEDRMNHRTWQQIETSLLSLTLSSIPPLASRDAQALSLLPLSISLSQKTLSGSHSISLCLSSSHYHPLTSVRVAAHRHTARKDAGFLLLAHILASLSHRKASRIGPG